jgi:hypothetical protein
MTYVLGSRFCEEGTKLTLSQPSRPLLFVAHSLGGILVKKVSISLWILLLIFEAAVSNDLLLSVTAGT